MTASAANRDQARKRRNKALAAVHIAKSQLGLDDDTYRAIVRRISVADGGPELASAGKLQPGQLRTLLDELRRLGARRPGAHKPANYPGKPHNYNSSAMPEMITKIEAQLTSMGLSWAYADAIAKRQFRIPRVAWVRKEDQLRAIIAALHVEQDKRESGEFIDHAIQTLGLTDKQLAELTAGWPKNWRRNRQCLHYLCEYLQGRINMLMQKEGEQ